MAPLRSNVYLLDISSLPAVSVAKVSGHLHMQFAGHYEPGPETCPNSAMSGSTLPHAVTPPTAGPFVPDLQVEEKKKVGTTDECLTPPHLKKLLHYLKLPQNLSIVLRIKDSL